MKSIKILVFALFLMNALGLSAQPDPFKVIVKGEGQPILFFPGFACTGDVWDDVAKELSKNYECHIFTFAGFGDVAPIEKPWLPKIKESVKRYITEKNLDDPIVIGHSLGGALGLWLASEDAEYKQIIVVDALASTGALMMPNFKSENMMYDSPYNQQLLQMNEDSFEKMAIQMASGMSLNKDKQEQIKDWMVHADRETYVYGYTDLLKLDLRKDIANITTPVTILAATHPYGKEMAESTYANQYKNLPSYKIEFAEGAAHFIMYDKPEWFLNKILEQLEVNEQ